MKQTSAFKLYRNVILTDLRQVARSSLLAFLIVLPLVVALLYRFAIPDSDVVQTAVQNSLGPGLEPHRAALEALAAGMEPALMAIFVTMAPGLVGSVYGLLLVDERDARTLAVLRVMPIRFAHYFAARLAAPAGLAIVMTVAAYPLAGFAPLPILDVALIAATGAVIAPMTTLAIVAFAPNKIAALAIMRVANAVLALPVLALFAGPQLQRLAWPIPSFWPMKALWLAAEGAPYVWALAIAAAISMPLTIAFYLRFAARTEV